MNVDYVVVSSEAGCGKSLTIHKCAYAYYKQGWSIYKFNHIDIDGVFNVPPLINNDKELLIVDDAQKVPEYKLLNLVSQSNNNCKIILAFTDTTSSIELFREPIRMTKKDAVNNMYSFYLQNKKDIFPIVKNINKDIGNQSMSISYEKILEECKKQDRPWMFNYVLRGGWKTEKENYQSVYHINHMSFLVASIAFNQIVLLDECSDLDSINKFYEKDKIKWSTKNLEILIKKKIIISIDELRIIHLKSAINLLYSFYMCSTLDEKKLFAEYMIDFLNSNNISFQGLLWLFNMSFNYDNLKYYLFNHDVINYCLSHMLNTTEDIEKGFYLYLLERIEIINKQRVKKFIEDNLECFSSWLSSPSDKTVYCFSQFVNGIINMRDDTIYRLKEFINFEKIYNCFKKSDPNYFYSWCVFFNRIVFSIKNEKARKEYSESLYVIIENINSVPIVSFICGLAELIHFDEKFLELIPLRKDELKNAFINNFNDSLDVFRGDAPLTIFGYSSIGKIDITEIRKKQVIQFWI